MVPKMKENDEMGEIVRYIRKKTGYREKTIKRILRAEREYFLKQFVSDIK